MTDNLENINPKLYKKVEDRQVTAAEEDEDIVDAFDAREVFGCYCYDSIKEYLSREFGLIAFNFRSH